MAKKKRAPVKPYAKFETALKSFWRGNYERAITDLEKVAAAHPEELALAERIRTLISVCKLRLEERT